MPGGRAVPLAIIVGRHDWATPKRSHPYDAAMRRPLAEAFGTFALLLAGCGAMVVDDAFGGAVTHVGVALAWGLVVMVVIDAIGDLSGAHINPAVTIAFWTDGQFPGRDVGPYLVAQLTGGLAACLMLWLLVPDHPTLGATVPAIGQARGLLLETLLSLLLMGVILNVSTGAKEKSLRASMAVGGTVALEAMFAGPACGASMNPARSLAPAIVSGDAASLAAVWIYLVGPITGMLLAVAATRLIRPPEPAGG